MTYSRICHFVEYLLPVNEYIARLFASLRYAIALSFKRSHLPYKNQYIRAIILVKGIHFYCFHASYSPFLKILISDPTVVPRVVRILRSGVILRTQFKIYECHLSFPLQFMCDFNLYGCGWIDLGEVWQRQDQGILQDDSESSQDSNFNISVYPRQSRMELEIDVSPHQILNRLNLIARNMHHEVKISDPTAANNTPLVYSVRELWEDERRRRRLRGLDSDPVMQSTPRERVGGSGGHWISEARWWQGLIDRIKADEDKQQPAGLPVRWDKNVMTTFESVEALWDEKWRRWRSPASGKSNDSGAYEYACEDARTVEGKNVDVDEDNVTFIIPDVEEVVDEEVEDQRPLTGDVEDPDDVDDDGADDYEEEEQTAKDEKAVKSEKRVNEVGHASKTVVPASKSGVHIIPSMDSQKLSGAYINPKKRPNPVTEAWNKAVR